MTDQFSHLFIVMNSPVNKEMSGGTRIGIELFHVANEDLAVYVVTPQFFADYLNNTHNVGSFVITGGNKLDDRSIYSIGIEYLWRFSWSNISDFDQSNIDSAIIYSVSGFLPDISACRQLDSYLHCPTKMVLETGLIFKGPGRDRYGVHSGMSGFLNYLQQEFAIRFLYRSFDKISVASKDAVSQLQIKGINSEKMFYNPSGVKLPDNISSSTIEYGGVFLGRLTKNKGAIDIIEIWDHVVEEIPDAKLAVIGSGSTAVIQEMEAEISKRGLNDNIELKGYVDGEEKFSILQSSRVFVFPSYFESFGLAIVEAMKCGLPVVAYNVETYSGNFGSSIVTVERGAIETFADQIVALLESPCWYQEQSKESIKTSREFNWENKLQRIIEY